MFGNTKKFHSTCIEYERGIIIKTFDPVCRIVFDKTDHHPNEISGKNITWFEADNSIRLNNKTINMLQALS